MTTSPLPYQQITDPAYAQAAARSFTLERLRPGLDVLRGPCPRCQAFLEIPVVDSVVKGIDLFGRRRAATATASATATAERVEPMMCTCEDEHPQRPAGQVGCGAYWTLRIETSRR